MNCRYKYKGHDIGTVEQLNDFLLEKHPHISKLGDKVFQRTSRQLAAQSRLDKSQEKIDELQKRYGEAKLIADNIIDGEEYLKAHRPYVGVSEFLKGQRNEKGVLYFPEFISGEYWSNRYMDWDKGKFTDDELNKIRLRINNRSQHQKHLDKICTEFEIHSKVNELNEETVNKSRKPRTSGKRYLGVTEDKAKYVLELNDYKNHYFLEEHT